MPAFVWKNAFFKINDVDLASSIQSLALAYQAESLDETAMGSDSRKQRGGLKSQTLDVTFFQKFSCVDAVLFPILGCQSCIEVRACNACSCAGSNPHFHGTWLLQSYPPMGGAVGTLLTAAVRFEPAGDLSRNPCST